MDKGEKRGYPRIRSHWSLYLERPEGKRNIGYVKDISLSGVSLCFQGQSRLDPARERFALKLKNSRLCPSELIISGRKRWAREEELCLGISIGRLERKERSCFVRFLSRSDSLEAEATLLEG